MDLSTEIIIFVLAAFVGFEVISKVPTTLHTPLMSQTNAIHGIVMLGGLIVIGLSDNVLDNVIGTIAIAFGTINIVGGFMVTDRMLGMFTRKPKPKAAEEKGTVTPEEAGSDREQFSARRARTRLRPASSTSTSPPSSCSSTGCARAPTDHREARQPDRRGRRGDRGDHDLLLDGIGNWG